MTHPLYSTTALENNPPERVAQVKYSGRPGNSKNVFHFLAHSAPVIIGFFGILSHVLTYLPTISRLALQKAPFGMEIRPHRDEWLVFAVAKLPGLPILLS